MKRFIRYLYEYEQGRRLRNVGFVKAEQDENECTLHIHGKGLHMKGERKLTVYLFFEDGDECVGIWQGNVDNVNPAINYRLYYTEEDVGGAENFRRLNGIVLESELGHKYAAVWNDTAVNIGRMRVLNPEKEGTVPPERNTPPDEAVQQEETMSQEGSAGQEGTMAQECGAGQEETMSQEGSAGQEGTMLREDSAGQEGTMAQEGSAGQEETMLQEDGTGQEGTLTSERNTPREGDVSQEDEVLVQEEPVEGTGTISESSGREDSGKSIGSGTIRAGRDGIVIREDMRGTEQEACGQHEEPERIPKGACRCTKIQRGDLARLPRCEWKWANNSFLLHGYYNYHHLALLNDGSRYLLGVPGIYHPQEAKAANVFGFTEFIPVRETDIDLTDDERDSQEQFGYWCRPVKRPLKM